MSAINTTWILIAAALVYFMQAGFAMVEAGFTRAKNAGNIIMKNMLDFCIGTPCYWLVGFGIMFGTTAIGDTGLILGSYHGLASELNYHVFAQAIQSQYGIPFWAYLIFQTVFCATTATIVSGAMAERTKFSAYCVYSAVISLVVYPVEAHWIWGGGWLSSVFTFHDFAGSTAVHMTGGIAALVGAAILGPRIGKYDKNGKPRAIPGHNITIGALGVFILWFGWFGFNPGSTIGIEGELSTQASRIFVTTNLAAACSTVATLIFTWIKYKKPDVSMTLNGSLAGLVAITAGCDTVTPVGAAIIGVMAGVFVVLAIEFIDKVAKIDDPVGAVGVHCCCGALGTLCVGFFSYYDYGLGAKAGLFYGGGFHALGVQALGVVSVMAYTAICMFIVFEIIKHTMGLRASKEEELKGLDITEHGLTSAYADFQYVPDVFVGEGKKAKVALPPVSVEEAVQVKNYSVSKDKAILKKVVMIINPSKFELLKEAMNTIGVTGMTMTNVMGCGTQKGASKYYRGVEIDEISLNPKIKLEMIISAIPVSTVVDKAKEVLYTGNIGDGKIFIYDVDNVIKVRTGEEGYDALQGSDTEDF